MDALAYAKVNNLFPLADYPYTMMNNNVTQTGA
jgi:C1A family cysteine protease